MALVVDCHMHLIEPDWNPRDITQGMSQSWARQVRWFDSPKSDPAYLERAQNAAWTGPG